ncbi:hypothetical protein [Iningainema tapete]|uniref:VWA containing CoxE family protein n=1 Tax=Iningainema tapete BLCC-T55 TaxID=2748662 RepID=A0A8J6XBZ6_9CYAN|nr:hypothetical protein [Iningainema tapete]MBD2772580.1 hypothetical protein [Iningainema tapete BLCC-T55]
MNKMPLLELFTSLREAGLPLGVGEYQVVLQALQAGFGIADRNSLVQLCCALWVKSPEEKRIFNHYFDRLIPEETVSENCHPKIVPRTIEITEPCSKNSQHRLRRNLIIGGMILGGSVILVRAGIFAANNIPLISTSPSPNIEQPLTINPPEPETPQPTQTQPIVSDITIYLVVVIILFFVYTLLVLTLVGIDLWMGRRRATHPVSYKPIPPESQLSDFLSSELIKQIDDEVQILRTGTQSVGTEDISNSVAAYFPVSRRQMKQSWRYLRCLVREGPVVELDLIATVNQIGRQGILLNPVLVPRRINRTQLLLLVDQDGSMLPFHTISRRLVETALQGGRLGRAGVYYFHNCPTKYFYHDSARLESEQIDTVLAQLNQSQAVALIFSDAGAVRGSFNPERHRLTKIFLEGLRKQVRYIAWLNPMPKLRWVNTTAQEIARLVPMFEINRQGLDSAIGALRGRYYNQ